MLDMISTFLNLPRLTWGPAYGQSWEMFHVDLKMCIERANIVGAYVVSSPEAIPEYTKELLEKIGVLG